MKFILVILTLFTSPALLLGGDLSTEELVTKMRAKYKPFYEKYSGYTVQRKSDVLIKEDKTGETFQRVESRVQRTVYFYKKAVKKKVLSYIKDGKRQNPADYKGQKEEAPPYPLFDKNSSSNYSFKLISPGLIKGKKAYRLKVIPRKQSPRHLKGTVFIDQKSLSTIKFTGTTAKLSFGVKRIYFNIDFADIEGYSLPVKNKVTFLVDIPVFFPNKAFTIHSLLSRHQLKPKGS